MRHGLIAALLTVLATFSTATTATAQHWEDRYTEREEMTESYALTPGALVAIRDISGPVTIETWDGPMAELHVVRSARTREELAHKRIAVDHSATQLTIHTVRENGRRANVHQRVTLKMPRRANLEITDVAGSVDIGSVHGSLRVTDIAGRLKIAPVYGTPRITDIAGAVDIEIGELGMEGVHITDIAGRVTLGLAGVSGAEVDISDISGRIDVDVPTLQVIGKVDREHLRGRIGAGGPPIAITDVAGSVTVKNQ